MAIGVIGTKSGMTRVFTEEGVSIPVTVVHAPPNRITQVKTATLDGYDAVQVTTGSTRANRVPKPLAGHFAKAAVEAGNHVSEFRIKEAAEGEDAPSMGGTLGVGQFEPGQLVDVSGTSKGKGFAGVIKRWNFSSQDATHGNSLSHRSAGSIGQCQTPGKVFKGKKMAGHLGNERVTVQNLEVVRVDEERDLILIKGALPGPQGGDVVIRPAVKAQARDAQKGTA